MSEYKPGEIKMITMGNRTLLFGTIAGVLLAVVFCFATTSDGFTSEAMSETVTTTPMAWSYLPFISNDGPSTPISTPTPPLPIKRLHGYASHRKVTDLPLEEMAEYTNFLYTFHRAELGWPDEADLRALRDAGIEAHLKLDSRVVEETFDEAELLSLRARLGPYRDVIGALCIIDEPYKPGRHPPLTEQELAALVDSVKALFPGYKMYVNFLAPYYVEQATGKPFPGVPGNIDLISTDIYIHLGRTAGDQEYKMRVGRNLAIILDRAQGRPVLYAAPAYGMVDDETSWPSPHQAQLDYELYREYGLVGLGWYPYEETFVARESNAWGASHWPELLEKHREIGQLILGSDEGGSPPTGDIKTLALRVNLTDAQVGCTEAELAASMFAETDSVNGVYSETSRGALTISGDSATVNIPYATADGCVREDWAAAADEAAAAAGYTLSDYDRFVYIMPEDLAQLEICRWGGTFSYGGERVWSLRCEQPRIVVHELGHTFGMYHAATETDEYGDHSDPMGGGERDAPLTQFNAPHLDQMGWLPDSAIQDVTTDGTYTIEATEVDPDMAAHSQILRLRKPDTDEYYYVSFRRAIGLDANLPPEYRDDVVSVHRFRGFGAAPGYAPPYTYLLALLGDGDSFTDTLNGITITKMSHEGHVATVRIGP